MELIDGVIRILDYLCHVAEDVCLTEWEGVTGKTLPEIVEFLHRETSLAYDGREMSPVPLNIAVSAAFVWLRARGIDPEALMLEKHAYNKIRPYRHGGKAC